MTQYIDDSGLVYEVWYKSKKGQYLYRVHSRDGRWHVVPGTEWRPNPTEAEQDLDRLARENGWKERTFERG